MTDVFILDAKRTPIGSFQGTLSPVSAVDLGTTVLKDILKTTAVDPADIDEVILGHVLTAGLGQNPARQTALRSGLPKETPAFTINKVCGSGLKAVHLGYQSILCGEAEGVIVGGQENMSLAPHILNGGRTGLPMGDSPLKDSIMSDGLCDAFQGYPMGITAENIAYQYQITREEQDAFAAQSQQKAEKAQKEHRFQDELVPVEVPQRKKDPILFDQDEFPRHGTTIETLSKLRPAFKQDGTVTAGNASGINDGAAALFIGTAAFAKRIGRAPLARIAGFASAGVDPEYMGLGPVPASRKCLDKLGWSIQQLDLIEANEAFAAQALAIGRELQWDPDCVNVNGGAIALGHPIGTSGARVLVTLVHEMKKRQSQKGLATLCIGGGQGVALAIEGV